MPRVLAQQPGWIARGSAGHALFQPDSQANAPQPTTTYDGPSRKIAHRGTEIFVAVGSELRWADVTALKAAADEEGEKLHRVLKIPTSRPIQQLSVSPSGDFIAILTSHTCHVAVLPSSSHLHSGDLSPLRLKAFQVGPTAHVLEQAPLMSAIWHPLSPSGNCLVTVTKDACVRLWEMDKDNRSTFDEPSLAIDLKKLANATSTQADFSASKYGASTGFSPDSVEMQVAAACFGGPGREDEHGWSSMTLWVAMAEGDVYALCPLLPSKWRAPAILLPSLSTSVVAKTRALSGDSGISASEKRTTDQQCTWLADIDNQDPMELEVGEDGFETMEVYTRPAKPGPIPKLQGPFYLSTELEAGDVTDIFVIAPKIDDEGVYDDEFEDAEEDAGLSVGVICLATSNRKVHVCLDRDGVEAEWLPPKRSRAITLDDEDERDLLLFEIIDLAGGDKTEGVPTFTASPVDRYELFVTTPSGVFNIDFKDWTSTLEADLANDSDAGVDFRLKVLLESTKSAVSQLVTLPPTPDAPVDAAIAIYDPASVGYVLLTAPPGTPYASALELPVHLAHDYAPEDPDVAALPTPEPRAPYQPVEAFYTPSALPQLLRTASEKRLLGHAGAKAEVRFCAATLQLMTEAHRVMSSETHRLGLAAADLFRRCERMRAELQEQVRRVHEIAQKVEGVVGGDPEEDGREAREKIEHRVVQTDERSRALNERVEELRKKMLRLGGKQLSVKEQAFAAEIAKLQHTIEPTAPEAPTDPGALLHMDNSPSSRIEHQREMAGSLTSRFEAVRELRERLVKQVEEETARRKGDGDGAKVPVSGFRMRKMEQVRVMLERETALVEGVSERMGRLSAGT